MLEITFQFSPGLYGAPRTLALARSAQDLAAASGVFLPTSHYLVGLLELLHARLERRCAFSSGLPDNGVVGGNDTGNGVQGEERTKNRSGNGDGGGVDLSAVAGLGNEDLRVAAVHSAISRGAAGLIAREAVCYRWSAGLTELCASTGARLERLLDGECLPAEGAGKGRARVKSLQGMLGKASAEAAARRARGSKHPGEAGPIDTFRGMVGFDFIRWRVGGGGLVVRG